MLYIITNDKGEWRREIDARDVESAALDWARRIDPMGGTGEDGSMVVKVTNPEGATTEVEITAEIEVHYSALRLDGTPAETKPAPTEPASFTSTPLSPMWPKQIMEAGRIRRDER